MAYKQILRFDKSTGSLVDVTPEKDKVVVEQLQRDAKQIRRRLKTAGVQRSAKYPYESETMAVDAEDVPRATAIARAHGLNTEFKPTGEPIITSRAHMLRHARVFGFYERNGTSSPRNR